MMQKKLQKKLGLIYSKEVIDVVQFGSSVLEGSVPNDIDIAVIYNKIPVKEQLAYSQEIKKQLEKKFKLPIHIKSYDLYSFFDKGNFAKDSILFYGKSLINDTYFSGIFGLFSRLQISYSLKDLKKKDKVRFNYLLNGKGRKYGLLRKYSGKLLKPGLIEISPEHEEIFIKAIKKITLKFEIRKSFLLQD